jgi:hypothetical protein
MDKVLCPGSEPHARAITQRTDTLAAIRDSRDTLTIIPDMVKLSSILILALKWATTRALDASTSRDVELPVVDLGYGRYQASYNVSTIFLSRLTSPG